MTQPPPTPADDDFYAGLRELAADAFPKRCPSCGRRYANAADFIAQTRTVAGGHSGLKQSRDDDGRVIVECFRNCVCGSTLMDCFADRRIAGEAGARTRRRFDALLEALVARGLERAVARAELIKVLHGEKSALIQTLRGPRR